jgi:hypothetical protein
MKFCLAFLCTCVFCRSLMAQATEPTNQPTDLVIEFAQGIEYSISFTAANGSPDGYLVLVREGSSPTEVPIDLDEYSSGGNTIGSSLVVYVGSSTEFNFSGWTAGETYYFDVFSYNGSTGTYNYLTSSPLEGSFTAISPEPFGAPYGLEFLEVTSTSILLEFRDPPSPEPASYLILMSDVSSPTEVPVDGTSYISGQLFGSSKVLVVSDPTIYIDNLDPETQYYFDIYAFLGSGTLTNYFTSSALEGSTSTLDVEPTAQPTGLTFSNITLSMTVSFTAASGNPDGYLVLMSASSPPPLAHIPEDGGNYVEGMLLSNSKVVHYGSETSFTVSNLEGSTTYYFQIYSFNGQIDAPNFYTGEPPLEGSQSTPVVEGAWSELNSGLYALDVNGVALLSSSDVLAATAGGVFRSDDLGSFWQPSGDGIPAVPVLEIIRGGSNSQAFAATSTMVYESVDGGVNWSSIPTGLPGVTEVYSLFWNSGNSTLYAATTAGVYRWDGTTWTGINTGLIPASVRGVAGSGSNLVVVTAGNGVFRSTTNGSSWSQTNIGLSTNNFAAVTMSGSTVLIGGTNGYVYRSSDAAASWSLSLQAQAPITDLEIISSFYLAATDGDGGYGYFGGSWQHGNAGLGSLYVTSVTGNTSNFFSGTADQGVYRYVLFSSATPQNGPK